MNLSWNGFFTTGVYLAGWEAVDAAVFAWRDKVRQIASGINLGGGR